MTITTEMPVGVSHGKVVGRFILAVGDSTGDPDNLPDALPASGSVVFTALVPNFKTGFPEPAVVIRTPIRCSLDANGRVLDPAGSLGVWLIAGTYRVSYSLVGATVDNHTIEVLPTHTNSAPLDLVNALPPGGPVLTESQYAELSNRINAIDTSGSIASVNGQIGVVVLDADDVGALTQEQADSLYAPAGFGGAVDSVNGKTGEVVLNASDVEALTQVEADELYAPAGSHRYIFAFSASGILAVEPGTHRLYNDTGGPLTITKVRATVGTAPTGASLVVDVNLNGVTIFTTQSNRPRVADGGTTDLADAVEVTVWPDGEHLTVDIDQIGSITPGADLTVTVVGRS